jgi:hypothetical protein
MGNELHFSMSKMVGVVHGFSLDSCDGKVRRVMSILQHDSTSRLASLDTKFVLSVKIYSRRPYIDHGYYISVSNAKALLNNFNIYERKSCYNSTTASEQGLTGGPLIGVVVE